MRIAYDCRTCGKWHIYDTADWVKLNLTPGDEDLWMAMSGLFHLMEKRCDDFSKPSTALVPVDSKDTDLRIR